MGDSTSKLYRRWWSMNARCNYSLATSYQNYGGRGIAVCEDWNKSNPHGWHNFKAWMINHGYDENLPWGSQTIDRIDNSKGYSPDNCRIISIKEQQSNKRTNRKLVYQNEEHTLTEWAEKTGLSLGCIIKRLDKGMSPEEIFATPLKRTNLKYNFVFNGKQYFSLTQAANEYGISMKRLSYLIHKGLSVDDAINFELSVLNK